MALLKRSGFSLGSEADGARKQEGFIDEFAIFTRVLDASEIKAHYANGN